MLDVRTTHANVLQRFVAQTGEQLTLAMQLVPASKLVQQIRNRVD